MDYIHHDATHTSNNTEKQNQVGEYTGISWYDSQPEIQHKMNLCHQRNGQASHQDETQDGTLMRQLYHRFILPIRITFDDLRFHRHNDITRESTHSICDGIGYSCRCIQGGTKEHVNQ